MKIYVHDNKTGGVIADLCAETGADLLMPTDIAKRKTMPNGVDFFLDEVDALIMEVTHPNQDMQFVLAQAILSEKPTLCLYAKNQAPRQLLSYVKKRSASRPIKTYSYMDETLSRAVTNFVQAHNPEKEKEDDVPSIKYTLRLTPRIDRYLDWISQEQRISKADLIRSTLTTIARADEEYDGETFDTP